MKATLRRLFGIRAVTPPPSEPVTFRTVAPAPRDPAIEEEIKQAQTELVVDLMKAERTSWAIRQELAGNVVSIVSGSAS